MICADTSFLLSLAGNDANSAAAVAHAKTLADPVVMTALNRLEFENALHLLRFRGALPEAEEVAALAVLAADEAAGRITEAACAWPAVLQRALRMSRARAQQEGHRLLDILQVAAALELGATDFLSFDQRQRALAAAEGLNAKP